MINVIILLQSFPKIILNKHWLDNFDYLIKFINKNYQLDKCQLKKVWMTG